MEAYEEISFNEPRIFKFGWLNLKKKWMRMRGGWFGQGEGGWWLKLIARLE